MNNNSSSIIHDAYICEIAALPITLIADPLPEQNDKAVQVCGHHYGSQKPIIVFLEEKGGLYNKKLNKWRNTDNGHEGFGVLELLADISNRSMMGADLKQMCGELVKKQGMGADILDHEIDYREVVAPQETLTFLRRPAFNVEDLNSLGCPVYIGKDGVVKYGFDCYTASGEPYFSPDMLHKEFKIYPLLEATLPKVRRNGEYISEKIISTPFNPLFVCFADKEEKAGCIVRPAMPSFQNVVFSKSEDFSVTKVARWLGGDAVFSNSLFQKSLKKNMPRYTGYRAALDELQRDEKYQHLKDIWNVKENGKQELITVNIQDGELKADNIIYCSSMQDAVATFYHLNALKTSYPQSSELKDKTYHVCFNMGGVTFSSTQYSKAHGFAHRIYTFFPNDNESTREARMIGKKYREIYRASLPDSFHDTGAHCRRSRIYQHEVNSIRDFFLVYKMDAEQAYSNDYDLNKFFLKSIVAALPSSPLKHCAKKDKDGETKDDYWCVNAATLWEFMASEGYCRILDDNNKNDKIGRFYHLSFPFYDELDRKSMVAMTRRCLKDYARNVARPDSLDYEKICDVIEKAREINDKSIDGVPLLKLNDDEAYNEKLDHFYFKNCALRITPDNIQVVSYKNLGFYVSRMEIMPWDFRMPFFGSNIPFKIEENPEYRIRQEKLEEIRVRSLQQPTNDKLKQEYADALKEHRLWARSHRWHFNFLGKRVKDLWKPLQVLRCFANEFWYEEQEKKPVGMNLSVEQYSTIDAHLANLFFCLAIPLWRYHNTPYYCAPYLLENSVDNENKAQGGSGKSTFVNTFMGSCANILCIDGKRFGSINNSGKMSMEFSELIPKFHRLVHIEDLGKRTSMEPFYNYVMGKFRIERKFENAISIDHDKAPGIVFSSNYVMSDTSDSTTGRFLPCGFSNRFCRQNDYTGQQARNISDVMPDFNSDPQHLPMSLRNQIIYLCAMAVQFVMNCKDRVPNPTDGIAKRVETVTFGAGFLDWITHFLSHIKRKKLYGIPYDLKSCFDEYVREYLDTSEKAKASYKPNTFLGQIKDYCNKNGYVVNPSETFVKEDGDSLKQVGGYRVRNWITNWYFYGNPWEDDSTVVPKKIRELSSSSDRKSFAIWVKGSSDIPKNYEEFRDHWTKIVDAGQDPDPILDANGEVVALTEEEKKRWTDYQAWRQGKRSSGYSGVIPLGGHSFGSQETKPLTTEDIKKTEEDLPF